MKHLDIVWTGQFKKDYKMAIKRHLDIEILDDIIRKLAAGEQLPEKNKDHPLSGNPLFGSMDNGGNPSLCLPGAMVWAV